MDLLKLAQKIPGKPPFFTEETIRRYGEKVTVPHSVFPLADFASAHLDSRDRRIPQVIAHRGYKAQHPENTIGAFEAAVDAGAHAIETDVRLSKDGVVVLSHDPDLKRCYGLDKNIEDCEWDLLKTLRSIRAPHVPIPSLQDLLELFQTARWKEIWLMLDVKFAGDPERLMSCMSETFRNVDPGHNSRWENKVVLGYWTAKYLPLCEKYFPEFPISNIGFSMTYCRQSLAVPNASFTMLQTSLVSPSGRNFIRAIQKNHRQVYAWTVNDPLNMGFCIRKGVDGVVTDQTEKMLKLRDSFEEDTRYTWPMKMLLQIAYFNFWVFVFNIIYSRRYGSSIGGHTEDAKRK